MTILQALDKYYYRLSEVAEEGWAPVKFGWCLVLDVQGNVVDIEDRRDPSGKKPSLKEYFVPFSDKVASRTSGIEPNFLSDKTAYVLGRTAGEGKRTAKEHAAFKEMHLDRLTGEDDPGLVALARFLSMWHPEMLETLPRFVPEMLDANIMFMLAGDLQYLHQRPAARELVRRYQDADDEKHEAFCLVSGQLEPIARLHRAIKGVQGAQSSGAPLVSCNSSESPAFSSYGKGQGLLAPTGKGVAFRYTTALNHMLTRDGPNRVKRPIGDATVVFWADASNAEAAEAAEGLFGAAIDPPGDAEEARKIAEELEAIAKGRALPGSRLALARGTRFHVLGLSPNAARLSVRFWLSDDFGTLATHLAMHYRDTRIEPQPLGWGGAPSVNVLLARTTAFQGKFENIPNLLAGEVMRSILMGTRYPQSLLAATMIRLRAGDNPGFGWHAALLRAVLVRARRLSQKNQDIPEKGEVPVALNREHRNIGYLLGRLFAVYELAQVAALGRGVKATMRDKYFASASATPANVFPLVIAHGQNHLSKARKAAQSAGWAYLIEQELNAIINQIEPAEPHSLPRSLRLEDQAEFAIGYYHQRSAKLKSNKGEEISLADHEATASEEGDEA